VPQIDSARKRASQFRQAFNVHFHWKFLLLNVVFCYRVNHDILMSRVARKVEDKRVLKLIGSYLQAGIMEDGIATARIEGTP